MENKDIAIVGMSCFAPGAKDITEYWKNLVNGVDSITDVPPDRIDPRYFEGDGKSIDRFYCKRGGFVPDITFDPVPYSILPLAVEGMDTAHLLALKMVYKALEDASVFEKNISLNKGALIIGKGNYVGSAIWRAIDIVHVGEQIAEVVKAALPDLPAEEVDKIKKEYQISRGRYQADSMPGLIPNLIASLIANKLDMQGPAYTIDAACASSLIAVDHSVKELLSGRCDIAIAGGVHAGQNATFWSIFSQLGALSHKQKITPFNEDADGLLIGEGGGFVVLKRLDTALKDNDRIYAVIKGVGISSDGSGVSVMAPAVKGQRLAIQEAWENANMDKKKLGYVEAHGTATVVGDKTELSSLADVFPKEECDKEVLLGSVKSNVGHAMPAAGILGLIKTTLALYNRQIPPTLHCERPLKEMAKTRFRPVTKLEEWDENKYPLVAGVNAFGFGGINAHVILEAYGEGKAAESNSKTPFNDKVIALSAPTKEALVDSLRSGQANNNLDGDYRLVLFDPTQERIDKAIKLVEKDKPWKGRQDIWFSNQPLLKKGGKVAFLYPGFDPTSNPEIDSIIDYFNIDIPEDKVENNPILNHTLKLYRGSEAMNIALQRMNIKSDVNAGHSLGEWFGIKASGIVSKDSVRSLLESLDPEQYRIDGIYFIATGCGKERINKFLDSIPNLYLSNDNCTNQVLLCGTETAINKLIPELQKEQIYYQLLSFQSGFHTPFIKHKLHLLEENFSYLEFRDSVVPMWSSNTLAPYPTDTQEIKELSVKHLVEPVRFRELIEKLHHEEDVKFFIQVGAGSLVGFIDDTLSGKAYSAISLNTHLRSTLEQLRRVLALLFIEGKTVNMEFLNASLPDNTKAPSPRREVTLQMGMDISTDFSLLKQASIRYSKPASFDMSSLSIDTSHPIMFALSENIKEMTMMQMEMAKLFESRLMGTTQAIPAVQQKPAVVEQPVAKQVQVAAEPAAPLIKKNTGKTFVEDVNISLEAHSYIMDHSLVKQPENWPDVEDMNPVIPMTMTFELLAEAAHKQAPERKITKVGPISVFQWMNVDTPFVQKIDGVWKSEELLSVTIKGFAAGDITLQDSFPEPNPFYVNHIDLGETKYPLPTKEEIYDRYMFHGPAYQGIEKVTEVTENGLRAYIRGDKGKGSLLDNMGQAWGLYQHLILDVNFVTFPVKVQDITFYQDMSDQDGLFECICLKKSIGDEFTSCELILKREGKLWCVVKGWQNRRFSFDDKLWQMSLKPGRNMLADELAPGIFYFYNAYEKAYCWNFLVNRYLNQPERKHYNSLQLNKRKDYLISRIALKDSLRSYVMKKDDKITYPVEYFVRYDSYGKPYVYGIDEAKGLEISIAHKGSHSISIVSDKPVGVDIESVEERTDSFMEISFTEHELELLKGKDRAEWSTRFWVAKEAYGKMQGIGLQGNPKRYEVKTIIDDENLIIEECEVKTIKHNNFIVGWTK
ncbi:MAG: beta-ketoacyl synthase N-terminal-like domain-containing protein [Dysgonomonas sp.]|nr:beta-ketoacyl synthase N-terminal-like domain-containing protein [Dysgonomonas sp.]